MVNEKVTLVLGNENLSFWLALSYILFQKVIKVKKIKVIQVIQVTDYITVKKIPQR